MCATALEQPGAQIETAAEASKAGADLRSQYKQETKNPVDSQTIFCPDCKAENELGWSFCQQCGQRLPQMTPQPPPQPPPPVSEPKPPLGVKTVASEPAPTEPTGHSMKTVEEESPAVAATVVADPTPPKRPSPQAQPPSPAKPSPPPPRPAPPVEKAPPETAQPMTEVVKSAPGGKPGGTNTCPQCGHHNDPASAFCSNCGAILTVAQTIVMSSAVAPPKARLHLVMEGGQAGEVYEIGEETLIGRTQGEITFPHDGFMSGRHARVERRGANFILVDEGSRNGTFIKLKGEIELKPGDMILVGKQLFRFERD